MKGDLPPSLGQVAQLVNDQRFFEAGLLLDILESDPDGDAWRKPLTTMILRDRIRAGQQ